MEILSIGQAGENMVKYAAMMNGHRAAGRSGVGAVMGSKKLKAIAVKGKLSVEYADPVKVKEMSRNGGKQAMETGKVFGQLRLIHGLQLLQRESTPYPPETSGQAILNRPARSTGKP